MNSCKLFLVLGFVIVTGHLFAQSVGINADGTTPNSSAMLDVNASNKGLLIPQIRLTGVNDVATIISPAASLLVYNLTTTNGLVAGYYYNGGTAAAPVWTKLATGALTVGPIGPTGPIGLQGITGAAGAKGDLGLTGAAGATGVQGVQGVAGTIGANGLPGTTSATGLTGILPVANGGTGAATLTANGVLLGNGTGAVQTVAPGVTGNVLVSDGTSWTSAAGGGGGGVNAVGPISGSSHANGATLSSGNLTLTPADGTNGGAVTTGVQTFAGAKTFSADLTVNSLTLGKGGGSIASNTATGFNALTANTEGDENTAIGFNALTANTTGGYNTASGSFALTANTTGSDNTATGGWALLENTTGDGNTATGSEALRDNTTGSGNTAIGYEAGESNTDGDDNTFIGNGADIDYDEVEEEINNATAIGAGALVDRDNMIQLGNTDVTRVITSGTITAGAVTYPNTKGTKGQVLTANLYGIPTWAAAGGAHTIGESYGGGVVFYVYDEGKHGLIAATVDQSAGVRWNQIEHMIAGASANGIGAGLINTYLIVSSTINASKATYTGAAYAWDMATFAAKICTSYTVTDNGVTYSGWYLPSLHELNLLYAEKSRPGTNLTGFSSSDYWSSTEHGTYSWAYANTVNFGTGVVSLGTGKQSILRVRAIRSF